MVTPVAVACAFTTTPNLSEDASMPDKFDQSPENDEAVIIPEATTPPVTVNRDPLKVKLPLSSTAPEPPAIRTRSSVRSDTISDAADKSVPLNNKFPLSSSSPPVPTITTRPDVKSSTLNVFA